MNPEMSKDAKGLSKLRAFISMPERYDMMECENKSLCIHVHLTAVFTTLLRTSLIWHEIPRGKLQFRIRSYYSRTGFEEDIAHYGVMNSSVTEESTKVHRNQSICVAIFRHCTAPSQSSHLFRIWLVIVSTVFLHLILGSLPVCLELPKPIPEGKMIQRPLAPTSVRELGEV
ncbi:hypothetical protein SADUNF_Sadunf02G0040600 [Salix dunnii]|uniref:Uncharacterized protein n=1 Tax=Salix dunnii TaxID=1413687 RepID=A0A835N626_9ROSI|nr:hypothetical protein SADUNF_Sadunf02G0040600 [Salix dunnii]